ncbi:winged helix-turn-helix domain-containing protein [Bremerella sp. JC770]|uniref:winged helix-turn-helix domain-containing protein n=1 Tax=Bremerella sp. JC770 TaxID=3232137 RepID=UPI00345909CC
MSISTDLHEETLQKIGETSGQVWAYLSTEGPVTITKLTKEVGEKKDVVLQAVGWLARENKLFFFEKGRNKLIGLIDEHGPPEP